MKIKIKTKAFFQCILLLALISCNSVIRKEKTENTFYRTVFENGKEGYGIYRIPSITVARSGKILTFTETRDAGKHDAAGNDIVMKTSEDNGQSWSKFRVLCRDKENALMNPTVGITHN